MSPIIKNKKKKIEIPSKYLLLIITILCVLLMIITFTTNYSGKIFNSFFGTFIIPIQNGITNTGDYFINRADELIQIRNLISENSELKKEIYDLKIENDLLKQDKYELNSLRDLYELDKQYLNYEKLGARVIGSDAGNWFSSFIIDKGLEDGLLIDMNVIANGGLVGRIDKIGSNWARVVSIIDDSSFVSGMILSTSDNLIVNGKIELMKDDMIEFSQLLDVDNKISVGDKIVTSNISDKYLPGIAIGHIKTIEMDANNLTKSGTLTPEVDFKQIKEVLVILTLKQSVD